MPKTVREKSNKSVLLVWHCCSSKSVKVSWMQRIKTQSIQKVCEDSQEPVRMWFEQKLMPRQKDQVEQKISIYAIHALQNQTGILQNAPSVGRVRLSDLVRMVWTWVVSRLKLVHGDCLICMLKTFGSMFWTWAHGTTTGGRKCQKYHFLWYSALISRIHTYTLIYTKNDFSYVAKAIFAIYEG